MVLPCSSSRTKRRPTPALSDRSTCVSLYFLRISFTYCAMIVLATILYQLLEVSHSGYVPKMPSSGTRPKDMYPFCLFWVHIQGISLCTTHSAKVIIYLISGKYKEWKSIMPLFGGIMSMKEGIIPNKEDYDIFLASLCFDMLRNGYH